MVEGEPLSDISVWSNFVSAGLVWSLAVTDNKRWHVLITLLTVALFLSFLLQAALTIA